MRFIAAIGLCVTLLGCAPEGETASSDNGEETTPVANTTTATVAGASAAAKGAPVTDGTATLTPENTRIQFVGIHANPDKPDPRTCVFNKFSGTVKLSDDGSSLESISVEIDTEGIETFNQKLTDHLRNPDFFDVRQYPKATFKTTAIEAGDEDGSVTLTADLTMLETTKSISFPATFAVNDGVLTLKGEFTIDRTEFGMDKLTDDVKEEVELTVVIGEPSKL